MHAASLRFHPDKTRRDTNKEQVRIREAYVVLRDPIQREMHDTELHNCMEHSAAQLNACLDLQECKRSCRRGIAMRPGCTAQCQARFQQAAAATAEREAR